MGRRNSNATPAQSATVMCNNMRNLQFIALFIFCFSSSFGQTNIKVLIKNSEKYLIDKVDIFDLSQRERLELPYKDVLNFTFKKQGINLYILRYHEKDKMFRQQIWLDTGKIEIQVHIDSSKLIIDTVLNSPLYYQNLDFQNKYSNLFQKNDTVGMNKILLDFYEKNIETPYSFVFSDLYLRLNQNSIKDLKKLKILSDKQGERFKWFLFYGIVTERMNNIFKQKSVTLTDFDFINREGKTTKLETSPSTFYILDFWFLGCGPCLRDHKEIFKQENFLRNKKTQIMSISTDKNLKKWKSYLLKNKYNWQNYLEIETNRLTKELKINAFPYYVVLDNKENIVATHNSFEAVINWLKKE